MGFQFNNGIPPVLLSSSPSNNQINVSINSNIVLYFSRPVFVENGNITIKRLDNNLVFETILANDTSKVTRNLDIVTINPSGTFENNTKYYINISNTSFHNGFDDFYLGLNGLNDLIFTTKVIENNSSMSTNIRRRRFNGLLMCLANKRCNKKKIIGSSNHSNTSVCGGSK